MIQPTISKQVWPFLASMSFVVVSFVNIQTKHDNSMPSTHSPWCSILFGKEGFISVSPNGRTVTVKDAFVSNSAEDSLVQNLLNGHQVPLSIMAISFEERSRYRINGHATLRKDGSDKNGWLSFTLSVQEAFGNCPKVSISSEYVWM